MSDTGRKIIEGLQDAVRGNLSRVTIGREAQSMPGSPEPQAEIKAMGERIAELEAALREQDRQFADLVVVLDKAHALLSSVAGVVRDGEQRLPVGIHAEGGGIARYLTAAFVRRCADWCDGEYEPCGKSSDSR